MILLKFLYVDNFCGSSIKSIGLFYLFQQYVLLVNVSVN